MYTKTFDIRWSDLDANRHVANSSYVDFLTETRMSYFRDHGITQKMFADHAMGPVIFSEEYYFIKEILPDERITIGIELLAHSPNFKYIKLAQYFFNSDKKLSTYSEVFFSWFDLKERKLIAPFQAIIDVLSGLTQTGNFEILPDEISLKNAKIPFGKTLE